MKSKYVLLASTMLISVATFAQKDQIKAAMNNSEYGIRHLRFVHNPQTNDVHMGDAAHWHHVDLGRHSGHDYSSGVKLHQGHVTNHNLPHILNHPKGIKGYLNDPKIKKEYIL